MISSPAEAIARAVRRLVEAYPAPDSPPIPLYEQVINCAEHPLIEEVLKRHNWNQVHASRTLGINRNTLRKLMRRHSLPASMRVSPSSPLTRGQA